MPIFSQLELENFKIFEKMICIQWQQFSTIVGLNGVGKSTVVDALEFAFCFPSYQRISVPRLKPAICNKNATDSSRTWVKVTFNLNGKEKVFQRSVNYDDAVYEYSINGEEVTIKEYKKCLLECNIKSKVNNFIIQQNSIESIAVKSAKERCDIFERMSGSITCKEEYISLNQELIQANVEAEEARKNLAFHLKEKKLLAKTSNYVRQYEKLQKQFKQVQLEYYFTKLYQIDKTIDSLLEEKNERKLKIKVTEKLKKSTEDNIATLKEQLKQNEELMKKLDEESETAKSKISKYLSKMLELQQKITSCSDKINMKVSNLNSAKRIDDAHDKTIEDLKHEYRKVEEERENYINFQTQKCLIQLEDEQYEEYLRLKSEAQQRCTKEVGSFDSVEREQDRIKDKVDDYERRKKSMLEQIEKEKNLITKIELDIEQINNKIKDTKLTEENVQNEINKLEEELKSLISNAEILTEEIDKLHKQIVESRETLEEDQRSKRQQITLRELKSRFTGVHGRLKDLCEVMNERYEVAITKIMGNMMSGIVVDKQITARECITFLKIHYGGSTFSAVETFLPLDYVITKSYDSVLRNIKDEPNTKLALDIMDVTSDEIRRAVHSVLGNVVICESDEQACDLSRRKQLNCVSLNGTFYKKNGMFSGGLASLLKKSKQWKEKETSNIKEEKERKTISLKELQMEIRKKQESKNDLQIKLRGLQERLTKHLIPLLEEQKGKLENKKKEFSKLNSEYKVLETDPVIEQLRTALNGKKNELENIQLKKNSIEDEVFAKFCETFNLSNIREYEEGQFKRHQERTNRRQEFDDHLDRIKNQIEYEKNRDTKTPVRRLEADLAKLKEALKSLKENEIKLNELLDEHKLSNVKEVKSKSLKQQIQKIEKDLKSEKYKCKSMTKDLKDLHSNISAINAQILNLRSEKHNLLTDCKFNMVEIPLCQGTIDKVVLQSKADFIASESENKTSENSQSTEDDSQIKERDVEMNYKKLPQSIKELGEDGLDNTIKLLQTKQESIKEELKKASGHFEVKETLSNVKRKVKTLKEECNEKQKKLSDIKKKFDKVKNDRCLKFNEFFDSVAEKVDSIFKELYSDPTAQAHLIKKNGEEPYLDGIDFSCIIARKNFMPMERLSGGEKTMCAMALMLSIFSVKPAPFLFFDEIDAALDNDNMKKISIYLTKLKSVTQIIIISHHDLLSVGADAAIGINFSPRINSSYIVHIDLGPYQKRTLVDRCLKNSWLTKIQNFKDKMESKSHLETSI